MIKGSGHAAGTCGELVQGVLPDGTAFQVSLPIDRWAEVEVEITPTASTTVEGVSASWWKMRRAAEDAIDEFGVAPSRVNIVRRNALPVGEGFGSSTADVIATWRAVANAVGSELHAEELTLRAARLEPTDGSAFERVVAISRAGHVLREWDWSPSFTVLSVRTGIPVSTLKADVATDGLAARYESLLACLDAAATTHDTIAFGAAASESARLHAQRTNNDLLSRLEPLVDVVEAIGLVAAHTGSCAALLFPVDMAPKDLERATSIVEAATGLPTWRARSLP